MQKNSIILHEVSPEELAKLFQNLQNQILELKQDLIPQKKTEYITRLELAEMLKCDISTIHNWTTKGKLIPYGIGNRVYYKMHEVEAALVPFGINNCL